MPEHELVLATVNGVLNLLMLYLAKELLAEMRSHNKKQS